MNTLARELAMAFLENRPLKMVDSVITMTEYLYNDKSIAKWEKSTLFITFPLGNARVIKSRLNPILEGYGCGISIESFGKNLYFVDNTEKQRTLREVEFEVWYLIQKDGFILKKW